MQQLTQMARPVKGFKFGHVILPSHHSDKVFVSRSNPLRQIYVSGGKVYDLRIGDWIIDDGTTDCVVTSDQFERFYEIGSPQPTVVKAQPPAPKPGEPLEDWAKRAYPQISWPPKPAPAPPKPVGTLVCYMRAPMPSETLKDFLNRRNRALSNAGFDLSMTFRAAREYPGSEVYRYTQESATAPKPAPKPYTTPTAHPAAKPYVGIMLHASTRSGRKDGEDHVNVYERYCKARNHAGFVNHRVDHAQTMHGVRHMYQLSTTAKPEEQRADRKVGDSLTIPCGPTQETAHQFRKRRAASLLKAGFKLHQVTDMPRHFSISFDSKLPAHVYTLKRV